MKKRVKIIAGAVLLGVLAVAGLVVLLMPVRVETETVQKADLLDTFTVSATVTPKDSQYVCAPLSGTVSEVAAKEGETVEQGAKIVVLDDSQTRDELNRQIESLKAQKTSAQSEGTSTKAQLSVSRQQLESQLKQAQLTYQQLYGEEGHAEQLYRVAVSYTHLDVYKRQASGYHLCSWMPASICNRNFLGNLRNPDPDRCRRIPGNQPDTDDHCNLCLHGRSCLRRPLFANL